MKDPKVFISSDQYAAAYTRVFLPDISDVQPQQKAPTRGKKSKKG